MQITVYGIPAPQGSKRFVGLSKSGRGILAESSKKVKPWREAVKWAALEARALEHSKDEVEGVRFVGPVSVSITFTLPKPKSAPKSRVTYPDRKPDIDKLVRSTFDALTEAGVLEDDARVVELTAAKVFPGEGDGSLEVPGAVIVVEAL